MPATDFTNLYVSAAYVDKPTVGRDGLARADWMVNVVIDSRLYVERFATEAEAQEFRELDPYVMVETLVWDRPRKERAR